MSLEFFLYVALLSLKVVRGGYSSDSTPSPLYLGLYNTESTDELLIFKRDNYQHSCAEFTSASNSDGQTEECKYYGDCCKDPMRIREKLETGTFSCQPLPYLGSTTIYVVDKCPKKTEDRELVTLCEGNNKSVLPSTADWPVTSTYTGVTYNNIYCAICHGVLDISNINEQLNNETTVQFWWTSINCNSSEIIKDLVRSRDVLERNEWLNVLQHSLREGNCSYTFQSSFGVLPHRCLQAIRTCPNDYTDEKIIEMCEVAPPDYREGIDGILYKNRFCQICHGLESLPEIEYSTAKATAATPGQEIPAELVLVKLKPHIQKEDKVEFSTSDHKVNITLPETASFLSLTNSLSQSYIYSLPIKISTPNTFWDLGSIQCDSSYDGICDAFMKLPDDGCSGPGCGEGMWQNLDGQCSKLTEYTYKPEVRENRTFIWPESLYGRYYSTCNPDVKIRYSRNCQCDTRCHYFGECCFDAPKLENTPDNPEPLSYTCMPLDSTEDLVGYAVVSSCPSSTDTELLELCKEGEAGTWSPLGWPVYDPVTTLSYKNIHCAACNNADLSLTKYWTANMKCNLKPDDYKATWDHCDFKAYKHPATEDHLQPYWCYQQFIVSTCPSDYYNWKISKDCEESISSWVYHNSTIYRNAFCAICNLGDEIVSASVEYLPSHINNQDDDVETLSARVSHLTLCHILNDEYISVYLNVNNNTCCYMEECTSSSVSSWGWMRVNEMCTILPFNISCHKDDTWSQNFQATNLSLQNFCSGLNTKRSLSDGCGGVLPHIVDVITDPPAYASFFFSDVGDIPEQVVLSSSWEVVDGPGSVCSNNSLISGGLTYTQYKLTSVHIQAKDATVPTNYVIELAVYDYLFISLSLLFILCYIIWMVYQRKDMTNNKLMMLCLLITEFMALVCFAISAVRAADNVICPVTAALNQYFFLAAIMWTNVLAFDITYTIYRFSAALKSKQRILAYSCYAFGLPLLLTLVTVGLHIGEETLQLPVYRKEYLCFLSDSIIIYSLFLGPFYLLIIANFVLCVAAIIRVTRRLEISSTDKDRTKKNVITCIKLTVCLGIGWVILFFQFLTDGIWPVVQTFIELQGVFLVSANVLSWDCIRKVQSVYKRPVADGRCQVILANEQHISL